MAVMQLWEALGRKLDDELAEEHAHTSHASASRGCAVVASQRWEVIADIPFEPFVSLPPLRSGRQVPPLIGLDKQNVPMEYADDKSLIIQHDQVPAVS